jgi:hypothetical protein
VVRPSKLAGGLSAVLVWIAAGPAAGQSISAPTPVSPGVRATPTAAAVTAPAGSTAAPSGAAAAPPSSTYAAPPSTYAPPASPYAPPASSYVPGAATAPGSTYAPGATTAPSSPYPAGGPTAALQGTITPWDPYATPQGQVPSASGEGPVYGEFPHAGPPTSPRVFQGVAFDYLWMAGNNGQLGINDLGLSATFALPFFYNRQTPILVTPGFAIHYWNGPVHTAPGAFDMPPQTFDAYLDLAWNPQVTQRFGGELGFRVGVYSDFEKVVTDSVRLQGRGLAVLSLSDRFQVKFGVWYIDRNLVKILPAGGFIWKPNDDVRFEVLFPNPKLAQRLTTWGTTEWWWYVSGDYGGGAWTITRQDGFLDAVDYNDLRVALGLEFFALSGMQGYFEVGLAFDRELYYRSRIPAAFYRPDSTVFLRAGISY